MKADRAGDPVIAPASEEEVRSGELGRRLRQFNYGCVGEYPEVQAIRLNARDDQGRLAGGIRAVVALHWLRIEVLFVEEAFRGKGLGSRLVEAAEAAARQLGAHSAALETFEWQAPAFYARLGYTEVCRMEDYVKGYYLALMRKTL